MESIAQKNQDHREVMAKAWVEKHCGLQPLSWQAIMGDASFRRYFRVMTNQGSFIVMDAPPPQESTHAYIAIAQQLRTLGLNTPEIFAAHAEHGFLLITDFGDVTYLNALNNHNAHELYHRALMALSVLQGCREAPAHSIPPFTSDWMWQEWAWHKEWVLYQFLGLTLGSLENSLDDCYDQLVTSAVNQPQVFMHRDFHSANLMVLASGQVGILDFQDAFIGPVTYDVVSLLRDCYIDWPQESVIAWVQSYWQMLPQLASTVTFTHFLRWFDFMGIQRHLKALFTFARKQVRDQQSRYLQFMPRTLQYLLTVSARYPELTALHHYLHDEISPRLLSQCAR